MINNDHLRRALANAPIGYQKKKPTSVPSTVTLEEMLTRAQNRLRSVRPEQPTPWHRRLLRWWRA